MQNFLFWLLAFASSVRNPLLCRLLTSAQSLQALLREALPSENGRKVGQISPECRTTPGKNMIFPCTTAAFTIPHVLQTGFVMLYPKRFTGQALLTHPGVRSYMRFLFVSSQIPLEGPTVGALRLLSDGRSPSRPCHRLVLFKVDSWSPFWNMYTGLTPHKIMPMPGIHKPLNQTRGTGVPLIEN
jgi:hypothetical protein